LSLFFNKTSDKGRTGPAWNGGGKEGEDGGGGQEREMTQTMYAHVNKRIKNKITLFKDIENGRLTHCWWEYKLVWP
jgi:hypothetical protein